MADNKAKTTYEDFAGRTKNHTTKTVDVVYRETAAPAGKILLPPGMSLDEGAAWLKRMHEQAENEVAINEEIQGFPYDAAYALSRATAKVFGFTEPLPTFDFWEGKLPPAFVKVPTDADGGTVEILFGQFTVPGLEGKFQLLPDWRKNTLWLKGVVKQKERPKVDALLAETKRQLHEHSLYKGQAIRVSVAIDPKTSQPVIQMPQFMKLDGVGDQLILKRETDDLLEATVLTPIRKARRYRTLKMGLKRGVLMAGAFGTGKTLFAHKAAKVAVEAEEPWTFIYVDDIAYLGMVYQFASRYEPCVIFAEDVDRLVEHDPVGLSSIIDGVDVKLAERMLILTTNYIEKLPPILLRPGRLDATVFFEPPDNEAAGRLVKMYGGPELAKTVDLKAVGNALAGMIPAVIREAVERAKAYALARTDAVEISTDDILGAVNGMRPHLEYLNRPQKLEPSEIEKLGRAIGFGLRFGMNVAMNGDDEQVSGAEVRRIAGKLSDHMDDGR